MAELRLLDKSQLNLMRSFTPTIGEYPNLSVISGGQLETGVYYSVPGESTVIR